MVQFRSNIPAVIIKSVNEFSWNELLEGGEKVMSIGVGMVQVSMSREIFCQIRCCQTLVNIAYSHTTNLGSMPRLCWDEVCMAYD